VAKLVNSLRPIAALGKRALLDIGAEPELVEKMIVMRTKIEQVLLHSSSKIFATLLVQSLLFLESGTSCCHSGSLWRAPRYRRVEQSCGSGGSP